MGESQASAYWGFVEDKGKRLAEEGPAQRPEAARSSGQHCALAQSPCLLTQRVPPQALNGPSRVTRGGRCRRWCWCGCWPSCSMGPAILSWEHLSGGSST